MYTAELKGTLFDFRSEPCATEDEAAAIALEVLDAAALLLTPEDFALMNLKDKIQLVSRSYVE